MYSSIGMSLPCSSVTIHHEPSVGLICIFGFGSEKERMPAYIL